MDTNIKIIFHKIDERAKHTEEVILLRPKTQNETEKLVLREQKRSSSWSTREYGIFWDLNKSQNATGEIL